jgi:hypothetical protein
MDFFVSVFGSNDHIILLLTQRDSDIVVGCGFRNNCTRDQFQQFPWVLVISKK